LSSIGRFENRISGKFLIYYLNFRAAIIAPSQLRELDLKPHKKLFACKI